MKITQSKERKHDCKRYCSIHKLWYINECALCAGSQKELGK